MRAVNLIPPEERRGEKAPMRTGPLGYVIVGVLVAAVLAVTALILTGNQISDREAEKASLQSQVAQAQAEATRLQPFADFAALQQAREATVTSLARSRFDWQRVLNELAIVIPDNVWLTDLGASVSPGVQPSGGSGTSSSSSSFSGTGIDGPSLQINGCASGHEAVAGFLASLHEIDGVTRVSVLSSDRPDTGSEAGASTGAAAGSGDACSSRNFIARFQMVAAFDSAQLGAAGASELSTGATATATTPTTQPAPPASQTAADQSEISGAQQQLQQQKDSAAQKTQKGRKAEDTFIPGTATAP